MLKTDVFLGLVVVSAMTLSGGESRSDGNSDGSNHNGTAGGIDSSLFAVHTGKSGFRGMQRNIETETIPGNVPTTIAYDPTGDVVYVCDGDSLYSVNKATGATTFIGTYFQNEPCNPIFESSPAVR